MHHPDQIAAAARAFTAGQIAAINALELPAKADAFVFECTMDVVADNLTLTEAGWDLFASTARLAFYGVGEAPATDRIHWQRVADASRRELLAAVVADAKLQAADFAHDLRREVA